MSKLKLILILIISIQLWSAYQDEKNLALTKNSEFEYETKRVVTQSGRSSYEVEYDFSGALVTNKEVSGKVYNYIHLKDFAKTTIVGEPALPVHTDIIALENNSFPEVKILEAEYETFENFDIHPALKPAKDTYGAESPEFEINQELYSKDQFYPQQFVKVTDVQKYRALPLALVKTVPVQFNPVTKEIRVFKKIKYRLVSAGSKSDLSDIRKSSKTAIRNLSRMVTNKNFVNGLKRAKVKSDDEVNYLIVTNDLFLPAAEKLALWKNQLGYRTKIISKETWEDSDDVKEAIHNFYQEADIKPDYFVIIGDHLGIYGVPGEIYKTQDGEDSFATDLYYSCMDGAGDYFSDLAHGRISVVTADQADIVIDKIINYEKNPVNEPAFYQNILNCAQFQDVEDEEPEDGYAARRFLHTSEEIRDYLQDNYNYTSQRIYYTDSTWDVTDFHYNDGYYSDGQLIPEELRSPDFNWKGDENDITTAVDEGKFMLFHRDHGYSGGSGWSHPYYTTSTMTDLNNGDKLPVVFSMNCHTGEFQLPECFSEKLLRMEGKGAVGVVGAAYYSYSGYNDALSIGMIDAIWPNPGLAPDFGSGGTGNDYTIGEGNEIYTMGDVVKQGLYAMIQNYGNNLYTFRLFHYFGDPAMKIWTNDPYVNEITATHNSEVIARETAFTVNSSCSDGLATLVYNGEIMAKSTLIDGAVTLDLSNLHYIEGEKAVLTISKTNHKPYVATLDIVKKNPVITLDQTELSYEFDNSNTSTIEYINISNTGEENSTLHYNVKIEATNVQKGVDLESRSEELIAKKALGQNLTNAEEKVLAILKEKQGYKSGLASEYTKDCFPYDLDYATGSVSISSKTENGLVKARNDESGWMSFDVSSLPDDAIVNSVSVKFFVEDAYYPYFNINPVSNNPFDTVAPALFNDINAENSAGYYHKYSPSGDYETGWKEVELGGDVTEDLEEALPSGIFSLGFSLRLNVASYFNHISGWNSETKPVLVVNYSENLPILDITFPNGSEELILGTQKAIEWTHSGGALDYVKIELSTDNGSSWKEIVSHTLNDGSFLWTVTGDISDVCLFRISDPLRPEIADVSNYSFKIFKETSWLSSENLTGYLLNGENRDLEFTVYTNNLYNGEYEAVITFNSNDEGNPVMEVPVKMTLSGSDIESCCSLLAPIADETYLNKSNLDIIVEAASNSGVNKVDVFIDESILGEAEYLFDNKYFISWNVEGLTAGTKNIKAVFTDGDGVVAESLISVNIDAATNVTELIPRTTKLNKIYPNPFNPSTNLNFDLHKESSVSLKVYNYKGELVSTVVNSVLSAGKYNYKWNSSSINANNSSSGVYFFELKTKDFRKVVKGILIK